MGHLRRIKKGMFKANRMPTQKPIFGILDGRMAVVKKVSILGDYKLYAARSLDVADNAMERLATELRKRYAAAKKRSVIAVGIGKLVDFCKKMFGLPDSGQSRFLEKLEREHRRR